MAVEGLDKFRIPCSEVTQDMIDYFEDTYNIDLLSCTTADMKLLIDFVNYGASRAVMNKILEVKEAQAEVTPEPEA